MAYQRISRSRKRELEEPDEFITVSSQVVRYISENTRQIIMGVIAAIVLVVVFSGLAYYSAQSEKAAQELLAKSIEKYADMGKEAAPEKIYQDLKPELESLLEKYPGKNAAKVARLIYAELCFNAEDYETAEKLYTRALKDYKGQPFYGNLVRKNLAYTFEAKKNYKAAINQMEGVLAQEEVKMKDEVLFNLGRLYAENDQKDREAESLKKLIAEFPNSDYTGIAKERLSF